MMAFVGRENELALFQRTLERNPPKTILNISGLGGTGKSALLGVYRAMCDNQGCPSALVTARHLAEASDSFNYHPVLSVLTALDSSLKEKGCDTSDLTKGLKRYRRLHRRIIAKFGGSESLVASILQLGLTTSLRLGAEVLPIAKPVEKVIPEDLVQQIGSAIGKYKSEADRDLLSHPIPVLSQAAVRAVNAFPRRRSGKRIVLFFDDYSRFPPQVDDWLRALLDEGYGHIDENVIVVVATWARLGQEWTARAGGTAARGLEHAHLGSFSVEEATSGVSHFWLWGVR